MSAYLEKHYIDKTLKNLKKSLKSVEDAQDVIGLLINEEKITGLYNNINNHEEVIYWQSIAIRKYSKVFNTIYKSNYKGPFKKIANRDLPLERGWKSFC